MSSSMSKQQLPRLRLNPFPSPESYNSNNDCPSHPDRVSETLIRESTSNPDELFHDTDRTRPFPSVNANITEVMHHVTSSNIASTSINNRKNATWKSLQTVIPFGSVPEHPYRTAEDLSIFLSAEIAFFQQTITETNANLTTHQVDICLGLFSKIFEILRQNDRAYEEVKDMMEYAVEWMRVCELSLKGKQRQEPSSSDLQAEEMSLSSKATIDELTTVPELSVPSSRMEPNGEDVQVLTHPADLAALLSALEQDIPNQDNNHDLATNRRLPLCELNGPSDPFTTSPLTSRTFSFSSNASSFGSNPDAASQSLNRAASGPSVDHDKVDISNIAKQSKRNIPDYEGMYNDLRARQKESEREFDIFRRNTIREVAALKMKRKAEVVSPAEEDRRIKRNRHVIGRRERLNDSGVNRKGKGKEIEVIEILDEDDDDDEEIDELEEDVKDENIPNENQSISTTSSSSSSPSLFSS